MRAIPYFLQNTTNSWYQSLVNKLQDFNAFKIEFLRYFSNNNSINRLANTFTTIKQGENEAVTTYLGYFHRNLCQIQVIDANYFTVVQILNQFIHGLHSSILQHICPMHSIDLQAAITNAQNFEAAELKANHVQAVNLNSGTGYAQNPNFQNYLSLLVTSENTQPNNLEINQHPILTSNIPPATITENKLLDTIFPFELKKPSTIPLFSGAALEKKPITVMYTDVKVDGHSIKLILDNRLVGSIITKQLIDQLGCRVDHTAHTRIITADETTKTLIGEIDNFPFEVNGIIILIKVLVIEATQYQALVGND
ncbi:hypothetical protein G9A89_019293 [Geosiphon pyriformis]|nr:hypothetical protein G9A89_019293 [Geosiphon pyriformis]